MKKITILTLLFSVLLSHHTLALSTAPIPATSQIEAADFDEQSGIQSENCTEGGKNIGWIENGDYIKFNAIDFETGVKALNIRAASGTDGGTVNIFLDEKSGDPHASIQISKTGGWQGWETFSAAIPEITGIHDVYLVFNGGGGYLFNLNWFQFGLTPINTSLTLLFPYDNENLTDFACSFKAKISSGGPYELQLCRDQDFSGTIVRHTPQEDRASGALKDDDNIVYFLSYQGKLKSNEKWILDTGVWYWRITGDGGATFSDIRKLTVNNDASRTPRQHEISARKPLFHFRLGARPFAYTSDAGAALAEIIPDYLKDVMVIDIGHSFRQFPAGEFDLFKYSKMYNDLGYKFSVDFGGASTHKRIVSPGEIEKIFRDLPNFAGGELCEVFYNYPHIEADNSQLRAVMELSAKYGKFCMCADMNWRYNKWQLFNYEFYDFFNQKQYNDYFLPLYKTTDPWGANLCHSSIQGMKLTGMVNNIGVWSDQWTWEKFGDVNTIVLDQWLQDVHNSGFQQYYPYIQHMKDFIYAMSYGSTVFMVEPELQWDWSCKPNDLYARYMLPFMKAVVQEGIIPSEAAVNKNYNVVVDTEFRSKDRDQTEVITYLNGNVWGELLSNTYGISDIKEYNETINPSSGSIKRSAYLEMLPNSDRYPSGIPYLPKPSAAAPVLDGRTMDVVKISKLKTQEGVNNLLNPYYAESENEAYAVKVDSSIFVFNTYENHDIEQSYKMGIHHAGIDSLMGNIRLMNYVMGRIRNDGKSLFIQTNAHVKKDYEGGKYSLPTYPSVLKFKCQTEPQLQSNEMAAITKSWDAEKGILTVEVNHTSAGAVDLVLTGDPSISYEAESIEITDKDICVKVDGQMQIQAKVLPESVKGIAPVYRSLNPNTARVSRHGLVTGISEGEVKIIAELNGISDTINCTVGSDVGMSTAQKSNIKIYPNPANDMVYISGISENAEILIYDLSGKEVFRSHERCLNISHLDPGLYILQLEDRGEIYKRKIMIR